ncbi:MAG TPA: ATP-binding protein [Alphaproteobacteria bacterium]
MALNYDINQSSRTFRELSDQIYRSLDTEVSRHEQQITALTRMVAQMQNLNSDEFHDVTQALTNETRFIRISEYRISDSGALEEPFVYRQDDAEDTRLIDYVKLREGLLTARRLGKLFVSEPYEAISDASRFYVSAVIAPVPDKGKESTRFIVGFIDLSELFKKQFASYEQSIHVQIYSVTEAARTLIYEQYSSPQGRTMLNSLGEHDFGDLGYRRQRDFGIHYWDVRVFSSITGFSSAVGVLPWITFMAILLLTILIGYITFRITVESVNARLMVERQTASLRDYTRRLEESNRDLDDFAHIASHDLKEPLRGIYNYAEFLLEDYQDKLDEEGQKKLATLKNLSRRMERLIDRLLEYSHISRQDLAFRKANITEVATEALETLDVFIRENHTQLTIQPDMPELICDRVRVGEIFTNLVTNAIKYNEKPEKTIEIGCVYNRPEFPNKPVFFVRDNGIGIAQEYQKAVFKIFKRLHGREEYGGGTGSGLTIVRKIVDRHGGTIWIESVPGEGATFYFTLESYA